MLTEDNINFVVIVMVNVYCMRMVFGALTHYNSHIAFPYEGGLRLLQTPLG